MQERIVTHSLAAQLTQSEIGDQEGSGVVDLRGQGVVHRGAETTVEEPRHASVEKVRHVRGLLMDDDLDALCPGFIDDRAIGRTSELLLAPSPVVDPDLDEGDLLGRDVADGRAALFFVGDSPQHGHAGLVSYGQRVSEELVVRPLAGRRHAGAEDEPGARHLPLPLGALQLDREIVGVAAGGEDRAEPVVGVALEVLDQILSGVILCAPARVSFVSKVGVGVDQGGNDRASSQVHGRGSGRRSDFSGATDGEDPVALYQEGCVFDYAPVSDDQSGSLEEERFAGLGIRRRTCSGEGGSQADRDDQRRVHRTRAFHAGFPLHPMVEPHAATAASLHAQATLRPRVEQSRLTLRRVVPPTRLFAGSQGRGHPWCPRPKRTRSTSTEDERRKRASHTHYRNKHRHW